MKHILIVDYDEDIVETLKEVLSSVKSCKFHYTKYMKDACQLLINVRYDIILIDYNLFKHNTHGIMNHLKETSTKIVMTNTLNDCDYENVLKKPFDLDELFRVLEV